MLLAVLFSTALCCVPCKPIIIGQVNAGNRALVGDIGRKQH